MATIESLLIHLGVDTKDVPRDAAKAAPAAEKAGREAGSRFAAGFRSTMSAIKGIAVATVAGLAVAGGAAAAGVMHLTSVASDLNETTSKTQVLFGKSADAILRFASTADKSLGQSRQAALDAAATFAVFGKGAGLTGGKLVTFSTGLTQLASDMASFSNTSPEEAIQAIGAALRGESDPIERYGVLLNETVLRQRALTLGIVKTTKQALTPQQRVLAAQAEIFAQTAAAQGDFARTSGGLANQQRILAAQWHNLKATVGQALLPVMIALVTTINTKVIPALQDLWAKHGPAITAALSDVGAWLGDLANRAGTVDWAAMFQRGLDMLKQLGPAVVELKTQTPALMDTLRVGGEVMGFLADHSDKLAKALPYLAAALLVVKGAQVLANVAQAASPALRIAEIVVMRKQTAAMVQYTAALTANTGAVAINTGATVADTAAGNVGMLTRIRSTAAMVAQKVATFAVMAATKAWVAIQWLLNAALSANPIGIVIIAIALLVAGILWLWNNCEGFRKVVLAVWGAIKTAIKATVDWILNTAWPAIKRAWDFIANAVTVVFKTYTSIWGKIIGFVASLPGKVTAAARGLWDGVVATFKGAVNFLIGLWNRLDFGINIRVPDWVPGVGGKGFSVPDLFPDIPMLARGAIVPATPGGVLAMVGEGRHDEVVAPLPPLLAMMEAAVRRAVGADGGRSEQHYHFASTAPSITQLEALEARRLARARFGRIG